MTERRQAWLLAVVTVVLASALSVSAAGPRLILVTSPLLERPAVLKNWEENVRLLGAVANPTIVEAGTLAGRPFYSLALFWGPEWAQYIDDGGSVTAVRPEQANQHARFYPAAGAAPALFVFEDQPGAAGHGVRIVGLVRAIDREGLDVLAKAGLRVRTGTPLLRLLLLRRGPTHGVGASREVDLR
jgi:hypothetical protein